MPLVKHGRVVEDPYLRVVDDAAIPDGAAVIVPAARFLADAAELTRRSAPTGLIWPNDRKVAELAPWLDRLALIALTFPNFRDGRAYTQAQQLRERYGFRGELRASRRNFARSVSVSDPRRLRFARGQEGRRRCRLCRGGRPLQRVLSAERQRLRAGAAPALARRGRRRPVHRSAELAG